MLPPQLRQLRELQMRLSNALTSVALATEAARAAQADGDVEWVRRMARLAADAGHECVRLAQEAEALQAKIEAC